MKKNHFHKIEDFLLCLITVCFFFLLNLFNLFKYFEQLILTKLAVEKRVNPLKISVKLVQSK